MTQFKKLNLFLIILFSCAGTQNLFAQPSRYSFEKYKNTKGDSLNYRMLYPDADPFRKYPLVIFLHGSGERGNDNDAQLKWGAMNFATDQNMMLHPALVVAPQCPKNMEWANFSKKEGSTERHLLPTPSKPMELLMELIKQLIKTMPVDTNRIYITGLSMGGYGTYDAIVRYPGVFAAAMPVCGGGDVSKAASIAHLPLWIILGAEDPAVSPLNSLEMLQALTAAGAHPGFTQYPEVGHFSWLGAYSDPLMLEWLFRQKK
ncbi:MAG: prolyl oligopeptidase family serine peptidase [Ferruginibacter sp.]